MYPGRAAIAWLPLRACAPTHSLLFEQLQSATFASVRTLIASFGEALHRGRRFCFHRLRGRVQDTFIALNDASCQLSIWILDRPLLRWPVEDARTTVRLPQHPGNDVETGA